ncbi:hypothetical protein CK203_031378 [Vitis vinifera]|uniref:Uncharacterized protein n=1 Tax=Vitis vinifera TaxID=29760 RepID=A0A438I8Z5_VITVI|nr:hypothetical protein CK203_031378 [Vitis vinifera]
MLGILGLGDSGSFPAPMPASPARWSARLGHGDQKRFCSIVHELRRSTSSFSVFLYGTTLIRLLPHAYDLYRAQNYAQALMQRFGGGCIISKRFRESEAAYEMIPVVTGEIAM